MTMEFFCESTKVMAHRGAPLEFPENTMPSFQRAMELGVDVIETDVHLTSDNQVVVIHDGYLDRVSNGKGKVSDYTLAELQEFDAGYHFTMDNGATYPFRGKGLSFLSLDQLLHAFPEQRFNIDLKDNSTRLVDGYLQVIQKHDAAKRVCTASRYGKNLKRVRWKNPQMATAFSLWEIIGYYFLFRSGLLLLKKKFKGDALQIPEYIGTSHIANGGLVRSAHERGLKVHVWTVNETKYIKRLLDIDVDGIFTDDPLMLKQICREYDGRGA